MIKGKGNTNACMGRFFLAGPSPPPVPRPSFHFSCARPSCVAPTAGDPWSFASPPCAPLSDWWLARSGVLAPPSVVWTHEPEHCVPPCFRWTRRPRGKHRNNLPRMHAGRLGLGTGYKTVCWTPLVTQLWLEKPTSIATDSVYIAVVWWADYSGAGDPREFA
jgi:hypothetical protein